MKYTAKKNELPVQHVSDKLLRRVVQTEKLMMANIEFSDGPTDAPDPYHSHPHEQVSYVIEGEIYLFAGEEEKEHLKAGDYFMIPSNVPHTIQRLTKSVKLIDCFTPIREDFL